MAVTPSTMLELGTRAPDFSLPDINNKPVNLTSFSGQQGLLVMFLCNHCPYVKHLQSALVAFARDYQPRGLGIVAISSNDAENYPQDGPELLKAEAANAGYTFPYLYDATQETAKTYRAACTPDFFLFDGQMNLVYRGQFDDSRPKNDAPITGRDLRNAADALLAGKPINAEQIPSVGCNIKWRPGNEPDYYG